MIIYTVEIQSQYEGGGCLAVFDTLEKAKEYVEKQKNFQGWDKKQDTVLDQTKSDKYDFWYEVDHYEINNPDF